MQVKIFESTDMTSGLKLVKETLGPDALILSTRTIRSGKLGIMGKPVLEITAAIDAPWPETAPQSPAPATRRSSPRKQPFTQWAEDTTHPQTAAQSRPTITYDAQLRLHQEPEHFLEKQPPLHSELDELKDMVKKLGMEVSRLNSRQETEDRRLKSENPPLIQQPSTIKQNEDSGIGEDDSHGRLSVAGAKDGAGATDSHGRLSVAGAMDGAGATDSQPLAQLLKQGISADTAQKILRIIEFYAVSPSAQQDENSLARTLTQAIGDLVHVAPTLRQDKKNQRRIALVGPTGVGKTTTLAKIAAHYLSNFSSSIALITIDTYRIAAVEQLKVYGAIMNLPVEVVITPEQLEQAFERHGDKELILIDTAGRSPKDSLCIKELATFLRADYSIDKHLVLSATTRESEIFETIKRFSILGIDNTIITKTDECETLGVMLDIQLHGRDNTIPFSWITNGQRVPEDLLTASPELVAELIMNPSQGEREA